MYSCYIFLNTKNCKIYDFKLTRIWSEKNGEPLALYNLQWKYFHLKIKRTFESLIWLSGKLDVGHLPENPDTNSARLKDRNESTWFDPSSQHSSITMHSLTTHWHLHCHKRFILYSMSESMWLRQAASSRDASTRLAHSATTASLPAYETGAAPRKPLRDPSKNIPPIPSARLVRFRCDYLKCVKVLMFIFDKLWGDLVSRLRDFKQLWCLL